MKVVISASIALISQPLVCAFVPTLSSGKIYSKRFLYTVPWEGQPPYNAECVYNEEPLWPNGFPEGQPGVFQGGQMVPGDYMRGGDMNYRSEFFSRLEERPPGDRNSVDFMAKQSEGQDGPVVPGWRIDPQESYSDWLIEIVPFSDTGGQSVQPYFVHKYFLGAGERRSGYFQNAMSESQEAFTRLRLQDSAAAAFPDFLDYIYGAEISLTTESALALRYLSYDLGVPCLLDMVNEFIKKDLSVENVGFYCTEAALYEFPDIVEICMNLASNSPEELLQKEEKSQVQTVMKLLSTEQQRKVFFDALDEAYKKNVLKDEELVRMDEELKKYRQELGRFKRAPATWQTGDFQRSMEGTYLQTNVMPEVGNYDKSGFVVVRPKDNTMGRVGDKVCPVFYYNDDE